MAESTESQRQPRDAKLNESRKRLSQVESGKEKKAGESNGLSAAILSTVNGIDKVEASENDNSGTGEKTIQEPAKAVDYPKGLQMFFIMLALVLTITLVALDQVSSAITSPSRGFPSCSHTLVR